MIELQGSKLSRQVPKKRQLSDNTLGFTRLKVTTKSSSTDKSSQPTKQKSFVREQMTLD